MTHNKDYNPEDIAFTDQVIVNSELVHEMQSSYIDYAMPGAVPNTATHALTNVTLPYAVKIANLGAEGACKADPAIMKGLNTYKGYLTYKGVADAQPDKAYTDPSTLF